MKNFSKFIAAALYASSLTLLAQGMPINASTPSLSVPTPGALDSRIKVFAFTPDVVYTLKVTVGMHTHIQLGADEELIEKARAVAQSRGTTLNNLIRDYMSELTGEKSRSQIAKEFEEYVRSHAGCSEPGYKFNREETHDRSRRE